MPPAPDRKPLAHAESRDPKSVRYSPSEWAAIVEAAKLRGLEPSALARDLSPMGLMIVSTPALMEAHMRTLTVLRPIGLSIPA